MEGCLSRSAAEVKGLSRPESIVSLDPAQVEDGKCLTLDLDIGVGVILGWGEVRILIIFDNVTVGVDARRILTDDVSRVSIVEYSLREEKSARWSQRTDR